MSNFHERPNLQISWNCNFHSHSGFKAVAQPIGMILLASFYGLASLVVRSEGSANKIVTDWR